MKRRKSKKHRQKRQSSNPSTKQHQGYIWIYHIILQNTLQNMISESDIVKNWGYKLLTQHVKLTNAYFHFLLQMHAVSLLSESNNHHPVNKFRILKTFSVTEVRVDTTCLQHKHQILLQYTYKQVHEGLVVREDFVLVL